MSQHAFRLQARTAPELHLGPHALVRVGPYRVRFLSAYDLSAAYSPQEYALSRSVSAGAAVVARGDLPLHAESYDLLRGRHTLRSGWYLVEQPVQQAQDAWDEDDATPIAWTVVDAVVVMIEEPLRRYVLLERRDLALSVPPVLSRDYAGQADADVTYSWVLQTARNTSLDSRSLAVLNAAVSSLRESLLSAEQVVWQTDLERRIPAQFRLSARLLLLSLAGVDTASQLSGAAGATAKELEQKSTEGARLSAAFPATPVDLSKRTAVQPPAPYASWAQAIEHGTRAHDIDLPDGGNHDVALEALHRENSTRWLYAMEWVRRAAAAEASTGEYTFLRDCASVVVVPHSMLGAYTKVEVRALQVGSEKELWTRNILLSATEDTQVFYGTPMKARSFPLRQPVRNSPTWLQIPNNVDVQPANILELEHLVNRGWHAYLGSVTEDTHQLVSGTSMLSVCGTAESQGVYVAFGGYSAGTLSFPVLGVRFYKWTSAPISLGPFALGDILVLDASPFMRTRTQALEWSVPSARVDTSIWVKGAEWGKLGKQDRYVDRGVIRKTVRIVDASADGGLYVLRVLKPDFELDYSVSFEVQVAAPNRLVKAELPIGKAVRKLASQHGVDVDRFAAEFPHHYGYALALDHLSRHYRGDQYFSVEVEDLRLRYALPHHCAPPLLLYTRDDDDDDDDDDVLVYMDPVSGKWMRRLLPAPAQVLWDGLQSAMHTDDKLRMLYRQYVADMLGYLRDRGVVFAEDLRLAHRAELPAVEGSQSYTTFTLWIARQPWLVRRMRDSAPDFRTSLEVPIEILLRWTEEEADPDDSDVANVLWKVRTSMSTLENATALKYVRASEDVLDHASVRKLWLPYRKQLSPAVDALLYQKHSSSAVVRAFAKVAAAQHDSQDAARASLWRNTVTISGLHRTVVEYNNQYTTPALRTLEVQVTADPTKGAALARVANARERTRPVYAFLNSTTQPHLPAAYARPTFEYKSVTAMLGGDAAKADPQPFYAKTDVAAARFRQYGLFDDGESAAAYVRVLRTFHQAFGQYAAAVIPQQNIATLVPAAALTPRPPLSGSARVDVTAASRRLPHIPDAGSPVPIPKPAVQRGDGVVVSRRTTTSIGPAKQLASISALKKNTFFSYVHGSKALAPSLFITKEELDSDPPSDRIKTVAVNITKAIYGNTPGSTTLSAQAMRALFSEDRTTDALLTISDEDLAQILVSTLIPVAAAMPGSAAVEADPISYILSAADKILANRSTLTSKITKKRSAIRNAEHADQAITTKELRVLAAWRAVWEDIDEARLYDTYVRDTFEAVANAGMDEQLDVSDAFRDEEHTFDGKRVSTLRKTAYTKLVDRLNRFPAVTADLLDRPEFVKKFKAQVDAWFLERPIGYVFSSWAHHALMRNVVATQLVRPLLQGQQPTSANNKIVTDLLLTAGVRDDRLLAFFDFDELSSASANDWLSYLATRQDALTPEKIPSETDARNLRDDVAEFAKTSMTHILPEGALDATQWESTGLVPSIDKLAFTWKSSGADDVWPEGELEEKQHAVRFYLESSFYDQLIISVESDRQWNYPYSPLDGSLMTPSVSRKLTSTTDITANIMHVLDAPGQEDKMEAYFYRPRWFVDF